MARVTVEDCVEVVPNRFQLTLLAAQRSRDIAAGSPLTLDRDNDKNPVVALREIAEKTVSTDDLKEHLIQGLQRHAPLDETEEELSEMLLDAQVDIYRPDAEVIEEHFTIISETEEFTEEIALDSEEDDLEEDNLDDDLEEEDEEEK